MPQDEFGSSFKSQWETYIERISVPPGNVERCSHGHTPPGSVDCSSFFSTDSTGRNASALALQAQYAAWRPYYTASLRRALGPRAVRADHGHGDALAGPRDRDLDSTPLVSHKK